MRKKSLFTIVYIVFLFVVIKKINKNIYLAEVNKTNIKKDWGKRRYKLF